MGDTVLADAISGDKIWKTRREESGKCKVKKEEEKEKEKENEKWKVKSKYVEKRRGIKENALGVNINILQNEVRKNIQFLEEE